MSETEVDILTRWEIRKFRDALKKLLTVQNQTITSVAMKAGKNPSSVTQVLNSSPNVELKTLVAIANAAGLTIKIELSPK